MPTIPNAPVKTKSKKLLPNLENGDMQPPRFVATSEFVQTESTTKGGEVLFIYPQHLNSCWIKLWVAAGWLFHTLNRFDLNFSVSNQMDRPRIMVYKAQTRTMYPWSFNHPLVIGSTMAGTDVRNVTKTRTAFPIAALNGHMLRSRLRATVFTVAVWLVSASVVKAKMIKRPPVTTKRTSATI